MGLIPNSYTTPFPRLVSQSAVADSFYRFKELYDKGGERLKDRYGISWQIVPTVLPELRGERDPTKARRVMEAMLQMSKLDIAGLEAAHAGRPRDAATTGELQCSH
jgi:hypothetical protein